MPQTACVPNSECGQGVLESKHILVPGVTNSRLYISAASRLRAKVTEEILSASTKNLELAQLRNLIHESVVYIASRSDDDSIARITSAEYSQIAVRASLYYEVALNLACSIATSVSKIASSIDFSYQPDLENNEILKTFRGTSRLQMKIPPLDPRFEDFLMKNRESLKVLRSERKRALHITLSAIHSFDPNSLTKSKARLFMLAKYKEDRIQAICATIQLLLQLLNEWIGKAQSPTVPTQSVAV